MRAQKIRQKCVAMKTEGKFSGFRMSSTLM